MPFRGDRSRNFHVYERSYSNGPNIVVLRYCSIVLLCYCAIVLLLGYCFGLFSVRQCFCSCSCIYLGFSVLWNTSIPDYKHQNKTKLIWSKLRRGLAEPISLKVSGYISQKHREHLRFGAESNRIAGRRLLITYSTANSLYNRLHGEKKKKNLKLVPSSHIN